MNIIHFIVCFVIRRILLIYSRCKTAYNVWPVVANDNMIPKCTPTKCALTTLKTQRKICALHFFFQINPRGLSFSFEAAVYSVIAVAFDPTTEYVCRMKGCNKVGERNPSQLNCITTLLSVLLLSILLWEALT